MPAPDLNHLLARNLPPWLLRFAGVPGTASFARAEREAGDTLARVAAVCARTLGVTPTPPQLTAAAALRAGYGVEMHTGEGKTLAGALAAACHAFEGRRVHVLTANDYLARRDAAWMGPLFAELGITVSSIGQRSSTQDRRRAYTAQVLYASVSEVGYDVLRDGIAWTDAERVHPHFDVAIVDEADAVMIDEAVPPRVLAGDSAARPQDFGREVAVVQTLLPGEDYEVDEQGSTAVLTERGVARVERALGIANLFDGAGDSGESLSRVNVALMAMAIATRDVDYVVQDGAVRLVSASRGRIARGQRWPDGLHAAVEAKEGIPASPPGVILDSVTIQVLLGRYRSLAGMSGTLLAVAEDLAEFYRLRSGSVERDMPSVRVDEPAALFRTREAKHQAIAEEVVLRGATGQPVLIGTQSVEESEALAQLLAERGVDARVLNARNDEAEADVVAAAGDLGAVTISTQISGRGTDIRLGGAAEERREEVLAAGGLRVIAAGYYPSRRLDAQLRGRAGRRGDPGSTRVFASLEDELVRLNAPDFLLARLARRSRRAGEAARADRDLGEIVRASLLIAEALRLDQHRTTWGYSLAISKQRAKVLRHRAEILGSDRALREVGEEDPPLRELLEARSGRAAAEQACRDTALWCLDEAWSEHLGLLSELRDGIHLRALGGEQPVEAFHSEALRAFDGFFAQLYARVAAELAALDPTDLAAAAAAVVRRPSSTWTYMIVDNPLGSNADRAARGLKRVLRGSRLV